VSFYYGARLKLFQQPETKRRRRRRRGRGLMYAPLAHPSIHECIMKWGSAVLRLEKDGHLVLECDGAVMARSSGHVGYGRWYEIRGSWTPEDGWHVAAIEDVPNHLFPYLAAVRGLEGQDTL